MKTKILHPKNAILRLVGILIFSLMMIQFSYGDGKVPQGLNYQGVARDEKGFPIADKEIVVEVTIFKDIPKYGERVWQETHTKTTNEFGLFNLVIGEGTPTYAGTLNNFQNIDWAAGDYFVQIQVDFGDQAYGNGLVDMGIVKLQSVPYALIADSVIHAPAVRMRDLTDVDVTNLANNQVLKWNGTK